MKILLNKTRVYWGVPKENGVFHSELWLTSESPGPVDIDKSKYSPMVLENIQRGLNSGALILVEDDKDIEKVNKERFIPKGERPLYNAANNLLASYKTVAKLKQAIKELPARNLLVVVKTKKDIYVVNLLDIVVKLEEEGKNRKSFISFLKAYKNEISAEANKHLPKISPQMAYYHTIRQTPVVTTKTTENGVEVIEEAVEPGKELGVQR